MANNRSQNFLAIAELILALVVGGTSYYYSQSSIRLEKGFQDYQKFHNEQDSLYQRNRDALQMNQESRAYLQSFLHYLNGEISAKGFEKKTDLVSLTPNTISLTKTEIQSLPLFREIIGYKYANVSWERGQLFSFLASLKLTPETRIEVFSEIKFRFAWIIDLSLEGGDFSEADFQSSALTKLKVSQGTILKEADFSRCIFDNTQIQAADCRGAKFINTIFYDCPFQPFRDIDTVDLRGTVWDGAIITFKSPIATNPEIQPDRSKGLSGWFEDRLSTRIKGLGEILDKYEIMDSPVSTDKSWMPNKPLLYRIRRKK